MFVIGLKNFLRPGVHYPRFFYAYTNCNWYWIPKGFHRHGSEDRFPSLPRSSLRSLHRSSLRSLHLSRLVCYHRFMSTLLSVAQMIPCTEAEGPGKRFALWVQGCPLRCAGCCNLDMLPFEGGQNYTVEAICALLAKSYQENGLEGLTLLGGEPTSQARGLSELARFAQGLGLDVLLFSGYTHDDLLRRGDPDIQALLAETDILVDGPFDREQPETTRRFIGSTNQRLEYLSSKAKRDDPRWNERNTLELRLEHLEGSLSLTVNGFPSAGSMGLWKRLPLL